MKRFCFALQLIFLNLFFMISCSGVDITYSALYKAIADNKLIVVEIILSKKKLDVNKIDKNLDLSPLHLAASLGQNKIVNLLIQNGANVNIKNTIDATPLMLASFNNHVETINILIMSGALINEKDKRNYNALMYASEAGSFYASEFLFDFGIKNNIVSIDGKTAYDLALENGHEKIAELLTKRFNHLIDAIVENNAVKVKMLIDEGANVNSLDSKGSSALLRAVERGNKEIVKMILDTGKCNIEQSDSSGATALMWAVELNYLDITEILLNKGASYNKKDSMPIIFRAKTPDMIKLLASYGVDMNDRYGNDKNTVLMITAENYNVNIVSALTECGANPYIKNEKGMTAYDFALRGNNISVAKYLQGLSSR